MLQVIKDFSLFNKIFNVSSSEWPKIISTWIMKLLYRMGFVIGWTVLVAMVVSEFGISSLPYLFVANAVLTILGTFIFSKLWQICSRDNILLGSIFASGILLLAAIVSYEFSRFVFFSILVFTISVFLVQIKIALNASSEEMFDPLQSERIFPLLESSETVGGILGGFAVFLLSDSIEVYNFMYLLIASLFAIVPFVFYCERINRKISLFADKNEKKQEGTFSFGNFSLPKIQVSYIKGLFMIIFLQWFLFNLLEFQYTKSVYQSVSGAILQAGSGFEHAFIHDLGALFMLFSASALLIQLFLGSRIIFNLGIVSSMLLHAVFSFLSLLSLVFSFNFLTAILVKNNFTISSVIFTNAYHSSYYSINEKFRDQAREFLEGIVRPIGAIAGTFVLILLQRLFDGSSLVLVINLALLIVAAMFIYSVYLQQDRYTKSAIFDLQNSTDRKIRINAVDILAQKGHKSSFEPLASVLSNEKESVSVRAKILRVFSSLRSPEMIAAVLKCVKSPKASIRESALDALIVYQLSGLDLPLFTRYEIVCALKNAYRLEKNDSELLKIINIISELSGVAVLEFLLNVLKHDKGDKKFEALYELSSYSDRDLIPVILPYFSDKAPLCKLYAYIFLYQFSEFDKKTSSYLNSLINSNSHVKTAYALFAIGELHLKEKKSFCIKSLYSKNANVQVQAAVALLKMGYYDGFQVILNTLFSKNYSVIALLRRLLRNVDVRILKNVDRMVRHILYREIERLLAANLDVKGKNLNVSDLQYLKHLYCLAGEYEDSESIEKLIISNKK